MSAIGDAHLLKLINQGVVYRMLRAKPGLSRSQLAQFTGLKKSTISLLVKDLIDDRWIVDSEVLSEGGLGRPSTSLFIDTKSHSLIGVEITKQAIQLVSVSASGELQFSSVEKINVANIESVLEIIGTQVSNAIKNIAGDGLVCGGIGISFSGVFDEISGVLRCSSDFQWINEPIVKKAKLVLSSKGLAAIPFFVQSNYHCRAAGAYEFREQKADTLIYLDFSDTINAGIVVGDRICAGYTGTAGNISHTVIRSEGPVCAVCGQRGCVDSLLAAGVIGGLADVSVCEPVVANLLSYLWKAFNPSIFVIGGSSIRQWPELFARAKNIFLKGCIAGTDAPFITECKYGEFAAAVGAAALPHYYRLRPLESPLSAIARALDFTGKRIDKEAVHAHVPWN